MAVSERTEIVAVETATSFLQWTPVIAGALVASAISLVLIAFGSAIGLSIISSSPTWRDASPALAVLSGLFLLLTALASFGLGGYVAGRLRERWHPSAHNDVVEFRDGTHGVVAWALAVVITGLVVAASAASDRVQGGSAGHLAGSDDGRAVDRLRARPPVPAGPAARLKAI